MPKESKIVRDWLGGVNTLSAASDLEDNESRILNGLTNVSPGLLKQSGGLRPDYSLPTLVATGDKFLDGNGFVSYSTDFGFAVSLKLMPGVDFYALDNGNGVTRLTFTSIDPRDYGFGKDDSGSKTNVISIYGLPFPPSIGFEIIHSSSSYILLRDRSQGANSPLLSTMLPLTSGDTDYTSNPIYLVRQTIWKQGQSSSMIAHYSQKAFNFLLPGNTDWVMQRLVDIDGITSGSYLPINGSVITTDLVQYFRGTYYANCQFKFLCYSQSDALDVFNYLRNYQRFSISGATNSDLNGDYKALAVPTQIWEQDSTNIIKSGDNNINMGGANDWAIAASGPSTSIVSGKLRVTTSTDTHAQGVNLSSSYFDTSAVSGEQYLIRAKLKRVSGLDPISLKAQFGGSGYTTFEPVVNVGVSGGQISDSEAEYECIVTAASTTALLSIVENAGSSSSAVFEIDEVSVSPAMQYVRVTAVKLDGAMLIAGNSNSFINDYTANFTFSSGAGISGEYSFNGGYVSSIDLMGHGPAVLNMYTLYSEPFSRMIDKTSKEIADTNMNLSCFKEATSNFSEGSLAFSSIELFGEGPQPAETLIAGPGVAFDCRFNNNDAHDPRNIQNVQFPTGGIPSASVSKNTVFFANESQGGTGTFDVNQSSDFFYSHLNEWEGYLFGPKYQPDATLPASGSLAGEPVEIIQQFHEMENQSGWPSYKKFHYMANIGNDSESSVTGAGNLQSKKVHNRAQVIRHMFSKNTVGDTNGNPGVYVVGRADSTDTYGFTDTSDSTAETSGTAPRIIDKGNLGEGASVFPPINAGANVHFYQNSTVDTSYIPLEMGNYLFYICYEYHNNGLSQVKALTNVYTPEFNPKTKSQVVEFSASDEFPETHTRVKLRNTKMHLTENTSITLTYNGNSFHNSTGGNIKEAVFDITSVKHTLENTLDIANGQVYNIVHNGAVATHSNRDTSMASHTEFDIPVEYLADEELGAEQISNNSFSADTSSWNNSNMGTFTRVQVNEFLEDSDEWGDDDGTTYALKVFNTGTNASNELFSANGTNLVANTQYRISFKYRIRNTYAASKWYWRVQTGDASTISGTLNGAGATNDQGTTVDNSLPSHPSIEWYHTRGKETNYVSYFTADTTASSFLCFYPAAATSNELIITDISIKPVSAITQLSFSDPENYLVSSVSNETICGPDQYLEANVLMTGPYDPRVKSIHLWVQKDGNKDMHRVAEFFTGGGYRRASEEQTRKIFYPDIRSAQGSNKYADSEFNVNNVFITTARYEGINHLGDDLKGKDRNTIHTAFYSKLNQINPHIKHKKIMNVSDTEATTVYTKDLINNPGWQDYSIPVDSSMLIESFYDEYGCYPFEKLKVKSFKCATTIGSTSYIGAPEFEIGDLHSGNTANLAGNTVSKDDIVIKSAPNRPTLFSKWGIMADATNDGDSVIALRSFERRLFQFKRNTLFITNVEDENLPILESTIKGQGVDSQSLTCETSFGVCWVNKKGVWLHDGIELKNIGAKLGGDEASTAVNRLNFSAMADTDYNTYLQFDSMSKQLLWYESLVDNARIRIWVYSFGTESWHQIERKAMGESNGSNNVLTLTNPILRPGGGIIQTAISNSNASADVITYNSVNQPSTVDYETKEFDFDEPSAKKSIKSIYITYRLNRDSFTGTATKYTVDSSDNKLVHFVDAGHGLKVGDKITWQNWTDTDFNTTCTVVRILDSGNFEARYASNPANTGDTATESGLWNLELANIGGGEAYKTNIQVKGIKDGNSSLVSFSDTDDRTFSSHMLHYPSNLSGDWMTVKLKPSSVVKNIYKFALQFKTPSSDNLAPSGFEINDISIVYRKKKVK